LLNFLIFYELASSSKLSTTLLVLDFLEAYLGWAFYSISYLAA